LSAAKIQLMGEVQEEDRIHLRSENGLQKPLRGLLFGSKFFADRVAAVHQQADP
jgi:hypothetical protein